MSGDARDLSICAAGHASRGGGNIKVVVGKAKFILKLVDDGELEIYQFLFPEPDEGIDSICPHVPSFSGVVNHDGNKYMRLRNVLAGYVSPKVMDIKIGIRTFVETECENPKPRPDLYRRLSEEYPDEVTDVERKVGAITKHRWMTVRDRCSTIGTLGFRIDGIAGYTKTDRKVLDKELAELRTVEEVMAWLARFCEAAATNDGDDPDSESSTSSIAAGFLTGLHRLLNAMRKSMLVATHEFIGSSILLVADSSGQAEVCWIDFAKTLLVPEEITVTHTEPWVMGNHEDGLFIGVENLMRSFAAIAATRKTLRQSIRQSIRRSARLSVGLESGHASKPDKHGCVFEDDLFAPREDPAFECDMAILSSLPCYKDTILDRESKVQERQEVASSQAKVNFISRLGLLFTSGLLSWRPWRRRLKWDKLASPVPAEPAPLAALSSTTPAVSSENEAAEAADTPALRLSGRTSSLSVAAEEVPSKVRILPIGCAVPCERGSCGFLSL